MSLEEQFYKNLTLLMKNAPINSLALAVSGGADSIALATLTLRLVQLKLLRNNQQEYPKIVILTVNHHLRAEAEQEIFFVTQFAKAHNLPYFILDWYPLASDRANIQAKAREARYDLMTALCQKIGINNLLTAHHEDDFIETFLIRRQRKSGVLGLSSSYIYFYNNIKILRPLYNISKKALLDYLTGNNISWQEDESNYSDKYTRNRIRKSLAIISPASGNNLTQNNLTRNNLIKEMEEANILAAKFATELNIAIAEIIQISNYGFAKLNLPKFRTYNTELKIAVLNYIITIISGKKLLPRYRSVEKIIAKINEGRKFINSLHGCILKADVAYLLIYREVSCIDNAYQPLTPKSYWDARFALVADFSNSLSLKGYFITRLLPSDYLLIKKELDLTDLAISSNNNHNLILFTLPVIKNLEKVMAIPHISYYSDRMLGQTVKVTFKPDFISRFTHFF